jgi:hypothetical protein
VLTADTYTSVLPPAQHKAVEATARLILTTARAARGKIQQANHRNVPARPPTKSAANPPTSAPERNRTAAHRPSKTRRKSRRVKATSKHLTSNHRPHRRK